MRIVNVLVEHGLPLFSTLTKNTTYTHQTNQIYKCQRADITIHFGKFSFTEKNENK